MPSSRARLCAAMLSEVEPHAGAVQLRSVSVPLASIGALEIDTIHNKSVITGSAIGDVALANHRDFIGGGTALEELAHVRAAFNVRESHCSPARRSCRERRRIFSTQSLAENKIGIAVLGIAIFGDLLRSYQQIRQPIAIDIARRPNRFPQISIHSRTIKRRNVLLRQFRLAVSSSER